MRIRVIGIGTDFGDDAAGLLVMRSLAEGAGLPVGVEAVACRRPVELLEVLDGIDAAVLVDATRSGRPPGTVHEPAADDLRGIRPVSSHGLGVREALAVARALGRAPERIAIVGIEGEATTGDAVSPSVRAALPEAAARVRSRCATWRDEESRADRGGSRDA